MCNKQFFFALFGLALTMPVTTSGALVPRDSPPPSKESVLLLI